MSWHKFRYIAVWLVREVFTGFAEMYRGMVLLLKKYKYKASVVYI